MIQKPKPDPIIEEIHKVRRQISDRFGGDLTAISADANARMVQSGCPVWKPAENRDSDSDRLAADSSRTS